MDFPIYYQPNQLNDEPSGLSIICIISWIVGVMVAVGFIVMFAKCLMGRRYPPCSPPTTSGPPRQGPLYPEPIRIAPPGSPPPAPPPPPAYGRDLEQGSISEPADRTTEGSKVGNQTRVPPPPYFRRC